MLKIRPVQFQAFQVYLRQTFPERMIRHLRDRFPQETAKEPDLRLLVNDGIERASLYALEQEAEVRRYLECMMVLGREFDRDEKYPWAGRILVREDLNGDAKMNEIEEHMLFGMDEPA